MALPSRRALLGAAAALTAAPLALSAVAAPAPADANLVRVCHAFAEAEFRNWWRYVTSPADMADTQEWEDDWPILAWITATPATTPAGWHAKALALSAWEREFYDDLVEAESDTRTSLLSALLRDMVAPARAEILARCAADYGPLPEGYTTDARWIGLAPAIAAVAAPPAPPQSPDAELRLACADFDTTAAEVARLEGIYETPDDVFEAAVSVMHAALVQVSGFRARTVGGLCAKAGVCRAVLAADEPRAMAGVFGNRVQRHDVLAWSTLADLVEVAA